MPEKAEIILPNNLKPYPETIEKAEDSSNEGLIESLFKNEEKPGQTEEPTTEEKQVDKAALEKIAEVKPENSHEQVDVLPNEQSLQREENPITAEELALQASKDPSDRNLEALAQTFHQETNIRE